MPLFRRCVVVTWLLLAFLAPDKAQGIALLEAELTLSGGDRFISPPPVGFTRRIVASGEVANAGISDEKTETFEARGCCGLAGPFGGGSLFGAAAAISRPGELHLFALAEFQTFGAGQAFGTMRAVAQASFSVFDVVFSGPAPFVEGTLPILIDGAFAVDATYNTSEDRAGAGLSQATSRLTLSTDFTTVPGNGANGRVTVDRRVTSDRSVVETLGQTGLLEEYDGGESLVFLPFRLPVGRPLTLTVNAELDASVTASHFGEFFAGLGSAALAFANTISFVSEGPIFLLPEGFSVDSADALIEDNRWLGAAAPAEVPEPSALWLALAVLMGVRFAARSRHRRSAAALTRLAALGTLSRSRERGGPARQRGWVRAAGRGQLAFVTQLASVYWLLLAL
jgi:hypothetical protein